VATGRLGITKGRVSNLIGGSFSVMAASTVFASLVVAGFARTDLAAAVTETALGMGLLGFTGTFDVAMGVGLAGGRAPFFGAVAFDFTFPGVAFPGFLAALFGFFEGIYRLRLFMKERAIIPTPEDVYRLSMQHILFI